MKLLSSIKTSSNIAFGSCNDEDQPQPLWTSVIADQPDLWIWLGDNVYADTKDSTVFKAKYDMQLAHPNYKELYSSTSIIGTWDDHDYGMNDGDKTYTAKDISKKYALDFLGVPESAEVRSRNGIYQSFEYTYNELLIRVLLLDNRYFKDPISKGSSGYVATPGIDILGEEQWQWLEDQLNKEEDILIIGNGSQVIPEEHRYEKWANYPDSRNRLLNLLAEEKTENIILISGDRHIGEMSKIEWNGKTIYDVTSSGMTHSYEEIGSEANQHRIGKLVSELNYGLININQNGDIKLLLSGRNQKRHQILELN